MSRHWNRSGLYCRTCRQHPHVRWRDLDHQKCRHWCHGYLQYGQHQVSKLQDCGCRIQVSDTIHFFSWPPTDNPQSQGTAVMYNSIEALPASVQNKITGVTLYGYTANVPNNGQIPNFPANKTKVFCSDSLGADGVCTASEISVNAAHLDYSSQFDAGVTFLQGTLTG